MPSSTPSGSIHFAAFGLRTVVCYQSQHLVRHLVGAALCGGVSRMAFTRTISRQPCHFSTLLTVSGPVWAYALAGRGRGLLEVRPLALGAYTLMFASCAPMRWLQTLSGRGDELLLAQHWFGMTNCVVVALGVLVLELPPVMWPRGALPIGTGCGSGSAPCCCWCRYDSCWCSAIK